MKSVLALVIAAMVSSGASAADPKPATQATIDANNAVKQSLPFSDKKRL